MITLSNLMSRQAEQLYDGILSVRIDAPIYFANTQNIRDKVQKYADLASQDNKKVQFIIIEFSAVAHIDTSALHTLQEMQKTYLSRNIHLCIANPNGKVMERLLSSGLVDGIGRKHIFVSTHDAVSYCLGEMDNDEMSKHPTNLEETFPLTLSSASPDTIQELVSANTNTESDASGNRGVEQA